MPATLPMPASVASLLLICVVVPVSSRNWTSGFTDIVPQPAMSTVTVSAPSERSVVFMGPPVVVAQPGTFARAVPGPGEAQSRAGQGRAEGAPPPCGAWTPEPG